jgi:hypothetical protein
MFYHLRFKPKPTGRYNAYIFRFLNWIEFLSDDLAVIDFQLQTYIKHLLALASICYDPSGKYVCFLLAIAPTPHGLNNGHASECCPSKEECPSPPPF